MEVVGSSLGPGLGPWSCFLASGSGLCMSGPGPVYVEVLQCLSGFPPGIRILGAGLGLWFWAPARGCG